MDNLADQTCENCKRVSTGNCGMHNKKQLVGVSLKNVDSGDILLISYQALVEILLAHLKETTEKREWKKGARVQVNIIT